MLPMLTQLSGWVLYLPQVLVRMRVGGVSNRSLGKILRKSLEDDRALRANRVGGLGALAWKNLSKLPQFVRRG
jgi:glycosyltransferase